MVLIGCGTLALLLWEPHLEGRNAHATVWEVYFHDPFLAYVYLASIPFFVALYQGFQVLGFAACNQVFSPAALQALRTIKSCAFAMLGFVAGAEGCLLLADSDDRAGGVVIGGAIAFGAIVMASAASTLERILQSPPDWKPEHNPTV